MPISSEQIESYLEDGYTVISGLIPEEILNRAETSLWAKLGMEADNPDTWNRPPTPPPANAAWHLKAPPSRLIEHLGLTDPALLACCTPEFRTVTRTLGDYAPGAFCCGRERPEAVWTMNQFPSENPSGDPPRPHVDGGHRHLPISPGPFRMVALIYLSDVTTRGGGTMIWPGSHRKFRDVAEKHPNRYGHLDDLRPLVADLADETPVEVTPRRGDVLFFDYLMAHSGSPNRTDRPRLAFRFFCSCSACDGWRKEGKWNVWCP
jgi:hypothetical protein